MPPLLGCAYSTQQPLMHPQGMGRQQCRPSRLDDFLVMETLQMDVVLDQALLKNAHSQPSSHGLHHQDVYSGGHMLREAHALTPGRLAACLKTLPPELMGSSESLR